MAGLVPAIGVFAAWCGGCGLTTMRRSHPRAARRRTMHLSRALALAMLLLPTCALAQPAQKPIRIIVPFAPGASADGIARAIGNDLGTRMGKSVIVENNVGAGGTTGLMLLAKSPPDGDTLGVGATGAL